MKNFSELKTSAKARIKGKIGLLFAMWLVLGLIAIGASVIPLCGGLVVNCILSPVYTLGFCFVFIKLAKAEPIKFENIFYGFEDIWTAIKAQFFLNLFLILWTLLLVVPGIIMAFAYSQTYFILAENKGMPVLKAISLSREMMAGHKLEYFLLTLSFFGWFLLAAITFGIAYIWVMPYYTTTLANFYLSVKEDYEARLSCGQIK